MSKWGTTTLPRTFCVITPARDEARFAARTIESVLRQSVRPTLWVIVDDGSIDETAAILAEYAAKHSFIRVVTRPRSPARRVGAGVVEAFYAGYSTIDLDEFEYICKLDLDLVLPPRYFEGLIERMERDPRLGSCSGKAYFERSGVLVSEKLGDENAGGFSKFFRSECFADIDGFVTEIMWDTIDGHSARMLGWKTASWDGPGLQVIHLRPMGTSDRGWWTGRKRHGSGQWFMGTGPVYFLAGVLFRLTRPPVILGGLAILWGYVGAALSGARRYPNPQFRSFLRSFHRMSLLRGKRGATKHAEALGAAIWHERSDKRSRRVRSVLHPAHLNARSAAADADSAGVKEPGMSA